MTNFDRASCSYDLVADVQKECCSEIIAMIKNNLPGFIPRSVLDLGAGTGYLTKLLLSEFPEALYSINDISLGMLSHAKKTIQKNISTIPGDMDRIEFPKFDLIVSSMAIHWSSNPSLVLRKMCALSKVFVFSILIQPSLEEWSEMFLKLSLPSPGLRYMSPEEVTLSISSVSPALFTYKKRDFALEFNSPREFIKYMRQLGSNYSPNGSNPQHLRKILTHFPGGFSSKYSVIFGLASQL